MRSVRYEHGVILKRGADLRRQEERILKREFEDALRWGSNLEESSLGIQCLMEWSSRSSWAVNRTAMSSSG
jgi:hypothetical protein